MGEYCGKTCSAGRYFNLLKAESEQGALQQMGDCWGKACSAARSFTLLKSNHEKGCERVRKGCERGAKAVRKVRKGVRKVPFAQLSPNFLEAVAPSHR